MLFSCYFFRFVSFFLAQVELAHCLASSLWSGTVGAFTRHVRRQGQRTWLVVLPPKLCPKARSSSWQHNISRSKLCHDCGLLPPRTPTRPTIKLIYHQYSSTRNGTAQPLLGAVGIGGSIGFCVSIYHNENIFKYFMQSCFAQEE